MNKLLATGMALSVFVGSAAAGSVSASAEMESKELAIQTSQAKEDVVKPEATPAAVGMAALTGAAAAVGAEAGKDAYEWGKNQLFGSEKKEVESMSSAQKEKLDVVFD
ncbi:hypothetical protein [Melghirimyces algeriensis]|uniref:Uncharacterized protein n=1 Tax=Melghirimyces algeriensis TaxID=910412 RepID=A0A521E226_9BACL|nr:hypothetical protein [Melghirimyces algeriensis]SMO77170.1 hypothetical protein SAMN06264849_10776 [Melghirimyces algeriensis]